MSGDQPTSGDVDLIDITDFDFKALIFDCDGTLAQTAPHHFESLREAFAAQKLVLPRDWYFARLGLSRNHLFDEFEAEHQREIDRSAAIIASEEIYCSSSSPIEEIARVSGVARRMRGRLPISVASGGPRKLVHQTLHACGLFYLFDHIVTFDDVGEGKPSPALFLEAARKMGVDPQQCLVFEDSVEGLMAAERAGMIALDVRNR
ncbi:HAD family phosphatase [Rhizobium rhizogenes]|uniref:HAD family hydrolase n=1 Tax=Rhizobium rhizogenes TaxID=359 RepID=UPI001402B3D7|nr:HAD family phosphatase [Rhizobium rhizogenes]